MKSEPGSYGIHDLERDGTTSWDGVRNYQARNFMVAMRKGDKVLFYHSNADPSGVVGVAKVVGTAHPDATAWNKKDHHYDPKASPENPVWQAVDLGFVEAFPALVPLEALRDSDALNGMLLTSGKASRLSVQPVDKAHFDAIVKMGRKGLRPLDPLAGRDAPRATHRAASASRSAGR
ncbi:MAG: hypothetical protein QOD77_1386 [Thermoplasmata archaeon]|nr:hypothetical protein [Thermoplasmata archaeon]